MSKLARSLRDGLLWFALLVVLPGLLYAMSGPDRDEEDVEEVASAAHPATCRTCGQFAARRLALRAEAEARAARISAATPH